MDMWVAIEMFIQWYWQLQTLFCETFLSLANGVGGTLGMGLSICPSVGSFIHHNFRGFHAFLDKPLMGLLSNLMDTFIMVLLRPINFWSCSNEYSLFPDLWLVEQFLCICRQTTDQIRLKFGGQMHYGAPQAWLTFLHTPLNFYCLLAYNWLNSFCAFANKALIGHGSNLMGQLIMGFSRPD